MTEDDQKPYISQSQLTMYERCGEQYRRRYIEKHIIPPGISMCKGSGVHGGSKVNFRQKIESHEDLPASDIIDASVATYDDIVNKGVVLTPEEKTIGLKNVVGAGRDTVALLSDLYSSEVAPIYQPAFVEIEHIVELSKSPYNLKAYLDMADINRIIADLKTGKKKRNQQAVDRDEQLSFYTVVYRAVTGHMPSAVRIEQLLDKKIPEHHMVESHRDEDDLRVMINRLNTMIVGLQKGIFIPCQTGAWWCDPTWCGYHMTCRYVK